MRGNGFRFCIFLITEGYTLLHYFQGEENAAEGRRCTVAKKDWTREELSGLSMERLERLLNDR